MKGIVKSVRKDKTGFKLDDDKWYKLESDALLKCKAEDVYGYEIEYNLKAGTTDVISFYIRLDKRSFSKETLERNLPKDKEIDWDGKDRRMVRMNCLSQANALINTVMSKESNITGDKIESLILNHAERFEAWVYRDNDQLLGSSNQNNSEGDKVLSAPSNVEGGGSSPLSPSFPNPSDGEFELWTSYKGLNPDSWMVKALWVSYAKGVGLSDKRLLELWELLSKTELQKGSFNEVKQ